MIRLNYISDIKEFDVLYLPKVITYFNKKKFIKLNYYKLLYNEFANFERVHTKNYQIILMRKFIKNMNSIEFDLTFPSQNDNMFLYC